MYVAQSLIDEHADLIVHVIQGGREGMFVLMKGMLTLMVHTFLL